MKSQPDAKKCAVVFGATGLVGKELVAELCASNDFEKITAVTRKKLSISDPKLDHVQIDDFSRLMELKEKLNAGLVFCCIGQLEKLPDQKRLLPKKYLDIPKKIAQLAEALSAPALVVISSIGSDPASSNFYLRTKGEMEKSVREIYSGKLRIVRPSLLMGNRDEFRFGEKVSTGFIEDFRLAFCRTVKEIQRDLCPGCGSYNDKNFSF